MAKTLAQGRKPGSGRKPGRGKTLREGRKPGSGRKKRDTISPSEGNTYNNSSNNNINNNNSNGSQHIQANGAARTAPINIPIPMSGSIPMGIPMNMSSGMTNSTSGNNNNGVIINGAENISFTSRDMEAVDALRELTYSPQFSPPMNSLPTTLPPIVPSRSFPAINRILTVSPRPTINQTGTLQSPNQQGVPPPLSQQSKSVTGMISPPVLPQQPLSMATFNGLLSSPLPPSSIPVRSGPIRPGPISNGNLSKNNSNYKNFVDSMPPSLNFITNSQGTNSIMNLTSNGTGINQTNADMNLAGNLGPMGNMNMNMNMNMTMNNNNNGSNNNSIMYPSSHQLNPIEQSLQRPPGNMSPKQHSQQSHFQ